MSRGYSAPFWTSVHFGLSCWEWMGGRQRAGYGTKWHDGRVQLTHRIAFEMENGPIEGGLFVCHKCDNRRCVRPDHMFLGTCADNVSDMDAKGRRRPANLGITHCKRGHEFTPANTYTDRHGKRSCRICRNVAWTEFYARRKGKADAQNQHI